MTSTTSKSNLRSAFVKTQKGRIIPQIIITVLVLATAIISGASTVFNYKNTLSINVTDSVYNLIGFETVILGLFSITNTMRMFGEIYKKQTCDLYFSTPIKREEYFVANYISGALLNIVLMIAPYLLFILICSANNLEINYDLTIKSLVNTTLALLAIYSAFIISAVLSGKKIQHYIICAILLTCPSSVVSGIDLVVNGIYGLNKSFKVLSYFCPEINGITAISGEDITTTSIISIFEIVLFFIVGLIVFKKRKSEVAEMTLSGNIVPYCLLAVLVLALCFNFKFGYLVIDIIIACIVAAIAVVLFSLLFFKKVFDKKAIITAAITCVVFIGFISVVSSPIFDSYIKYVPDVSEIESVTLNEKENDEYVTSIFSGISYLSVDNEFDGNKAEIKSKEDIEKAIALHSKTIEDETINRSKTNTTINIIKELFFGTSDYESKTSFQITYKLKNGTEVTRAYEAATSCIFDEYIDVLHTEEVIDQMDILNIDENSIIYCEVEGSGTYVDYADVKKAYKADLLAIDNDKFSNYVGIYNPATFEYTEDEIIEEEYDPNISCIYVYYVKSNVTKEQMEVLKSLSQDELDNLRFDWEDSNISTLKGVEVEESRIDIWKSNKNLMKFVPQDIIDEYIETPVLY